jgi:hypothetical protein
MRRAARMCENCPFRLKLSRAEVLELAVIKPEDFECHTEAGYTSTDIQCRGHWQARRKFGNVEQKVDEK